MSQEYTTTYARLLAAQAKMKNPAKSAENPHFKSSYAPLDAVLAVVRPALLDAGLLLLQSPIAIDGQQWLESYVMDAEGCKIELGTIRIIDGTPQQVGSAITYARRYALLSAFALVGEEDDDGNAASAAPNPTPKPTPKPAPRPAPKPKNPYLATFGQMAAKYAADSGKALADISREVSLAMMASAGIPLSDIGSDEDAARAEVILQQMIDAPEEALF